MAKKKQSTKSKAAVKKAPTKSEIFTGIAEKTELSKKEVAAVFDELQVVIKKNLGSRGAGMFTLPGVCKMVTKKKPATKARMGRNPFSGEMQMFKAKPASKTVRIRALKGLRDMIK